MKVTKPLKVSFLEYEKAVREARQYINRYDRVRWKICSIAARVCDTSHGGRKAAGIFSITKFAQAIELHPKTLHQWMQVKRLVVDKLPATELKNKSIQFSDLADVCDRVDKDSTKREVLNSLRVQMAIPLENKKFIKYEKNLNAILYNARRPLQMRLVENQFIEKIISKCTLINKLLTVELKLRKQFTIEQRVKSKNSLIKKAINEAKES